MSLNSGQKKTGKSTFIYCRTHISGRDATDFSTHILYNTSCNQKAQLFQGAEANFENQQLFEISDEIKQLYRDLKRDADIFAQDLRNAFLKKLQRRTLLQSYDQHLKDFTTTLAIPGFSAGTSKNHVIRDRALRSLLAQSKMNYIELTQIRELFGVDFILFEARQRLHPNLSGSLSEPLGRN